LQVEGIAFEPSPNEAYCILLSLCNIKSFPEACLSKRGKQKRAARRLTAPPSIFLVLTLKAPNRRSQLPLLGKILELLGLGFAPKLPRLYQELPLLWLPGALCESLTADSPLKPQALCLFP
jgi:hypothetical protein